MLNKIKEIIKEIEKAKQKRIKEEIIRLIRKTDFEKWVEQEIREESGF